MLIIAIIIYLFIFHISFADENNGNGVSLSERVTLPGHAEVSSVKSMGVSKILKLLRKIFNILWGYISFLVKIYMIILRLMLYDMKLRAACLSLALFSIKSEN